MTSASSPRMTVTVTLKTGGAIAMLRAVGITEGHCSDDDIDDALARSGLAGGGSGKANGRRLAAKNAIRTMCVALGWRRKEPDED